MGVELTELVGKNRDAIAKQMFMLQRAGVVVHQRNRTYFLLKQYLPQIGQPIVDFGHFPAAFERADETAALRFVLDIGFWNS